MSEKWTKLAKVEGVDIPEKCEVCLFDRRNPPRFYVRQSGEWLVRWLREEEEQKLIKYLNWEG